MSTTYAGNPANYPASITEPSDGDNKSAASVNVGLEGLADRTAYLSAHKADPALYQQKVFANSSDTESTQFSITLGTYEKPSPSNPYIEFTGCAAGDVINVWSHWHVLRSASSAGVAVFRLYIIEDVDGTPAESALSFAKSWLWVPDAAPQTSERLAFPLNGRVVLQLGGKVRIGLEGRVISGTGVNVNFSGVQNLWAERVKAV